MPWEAMVLGGFFASQLDFVFFIYGLTFILMGVQGLALRRRGQLLPWGFLAAFGFIHGVNEWLDMLALSLPDTSTFKGLRLAVMAASFIVLLEFGRRGLARDGRPIMGQWLTPALLGISALGVMSHDLNGLNAACRYSLGFPGALMAGAALWQTSRLGSGEERSGIRLAAASILIYAPMTGMIVPKAVFFPANWLNHETFFQTMGFPVQLARAICAFSAMTGFWLCGQRPEPEAARTGPSYRWSYPAVFLLVVMLGWLAANQQGKSLDAELRGQLAEQAAQISQTIDPDNVNALFTAADKGTPAFERVRAQMIAYERLGGQKGIWSAADHGGIFRFGPESYKENTPAASPPGTLYERPPREMWKILKDKKPIAIGPYTDEYGTFISSFAPLLDPRTNEVLMVVGCDITADDWEAPIASARLLPILGTLVLLLVLLGGMSAVRWRNSLPADQRQRFRHLETIQVGVLGLALTAAVTLLILKSENRQRKQSFDWLAQSCSDAVRREILAIRVDTEAIARFQESSEHVTRQEFRTFVAPISKNTTVQAFEWIPRVPAAEKEQFEAQARREGGGGFSIWTRNAQGQKIPASGRADYYPVCCVEPAKGNGPAIGFDLGSEPVRRAALESAARTGLITGSDPITLVQETERQQGILVFRPVFAGKAAGEGSLRGFALAAVRLQSLLASAVAPVAQGKNLVDVHLVDLMATDGPRMLAVYPMEHTEDHDEMMDGAYLKRHQFTSVHPVFAFGRAYAIMTHPSASFYAAYPARGHVATGTACLLLTIILTVLAGFLRNRQEYLERQVRERTKELQESEENLSITLRSIGDGVIATDTEGRVTRMNPVAETLTGWTLHEVIGQPFEEVFRIINTQTREPAENPVAKALSSGNVVDMANDTALIARDGSERQIADSAAPIRDAEGRIVGAVLVFHDVTQEYETREALREKSEELDRYFTTALDLFCIADVDGYFRRLNQQWEVVLGYPLAELEGRRFMDFVHPDDVEATVEVVSRLANQEAISSFVNRFRCKDGSYRWIEWRASAQGKLIHAAARDITDRKQAEEALRESEERYRAVFEGSAQGILIADGKTRQFIYANPSICRLLGYTEMELLKLGVADIHPKDSLRQVASEFESQIRGEKSLAAALPCLRKDGTVLYADVTASPLMLEGGRECMVGFFSDITERKQMEEALQEKSALLTTVINAVPDFVFAKDTSLRTIICNEAFAAALGKKPEELVGHTDIENGWDPELVRGNPAEGKRGFEDDDRDALSGKMIHNPNDPANTPNGVLTYDTYKLPLHGKDGEIIGMLGVSRDITERKQMEEALRESEEEFRGLFNESRDGIAVADAETKRLVQVNQAMCKMSGYTREEFEGMGLNDIHPEEALPYVLEQFERQAKGEARIAADIPVKRKDGSVLFADVNSAPLSIGGRLCLLGVFRDITERKLAEEALQEKERRYRSLWESANEGFCLHDLVTDASGQAVDYRILEVNPAYERITGLKADDVVGRLASQVYGTGDAPYLDIYARVASTGVSESFEAYLPRLGRHFSISVFSPSPGLLATAFSDISERMAHEEVLSHQATHDSLTGLPNREYFESSLGEHTASAVGQKRKVFDLMFMDLDKFKLINDALGHKVGDLLLVAVADRLRSCLRSNDVLARMGGDEFTVIVQSAGRRSLTESIAARIIDSISRPFEIEGHKFVIGVSFGLAAYPSDGTDSVTLLKHADAAMYKAKEAGRGTFRWFTGESEAEDRLHADMERDLRHALEDNHLKVHYQPVVRLDDGSLHGAEALLRWDHPEKGMISPSLFIPVAEEIGLIASIGDYILRTACSQTMAWHDEGMQISQISVNVSTVQIRDTSWLHSVKAAISDSGLDPRHLVLELTESHFAADYQSLRACLQKVQQLGIGIAIDDFGMGQSSLSRLKDFAVIELKIDGSFVRDIERNENDKALLRSIIEMAHDQGIKVTAEWVETEAQADILRGSGCDFAQGYFFSPPLPADEFRAFALAQTEKRKRRAA
jgi:diguanylate cyclase (GGDEF)-like protein/PAS domain S-box-containing protein